MAEIKRLPTEVTQERIANSLENIAEGITKRIIKVSYSELATLKNNEELQPGAFYRITDYETTTIQPETRSAGHLFDIIVQALDEKTVSENAQAIHSERDVNGYFNDVKLEAWKLKYTLENDTIKYFWADDVNGKGIIYRMIDEYDNDLPYDFKNMQFKRYMVDEFDKNPELVGRYYALKDLNGSIRPSGAVVDEGDFIWAYTFTVIDEAGIVNDVSLNVNKEFTTDEGGYFYTEKNSVGVFYHEYYDDDLEKLVIIKALPNNVIVYDYGLYEYWDFYGFGYNTIGNNFNSNTIVYNFSDNTIGDSFGYNTIGVSFSNNTIGNNFSNNTIGNNFGYNTIGNSFNSNTIGYDFGSNTIGNNFRNNTIGNNFNSNTIGYDFGSNTIGDSFGYNTIGVSFRSNTIGAYYGYCQFGEGVQYVKLDQVGAYNQEYKNITIKTGVVGASSNNRLVIEDEVALRNKAYNIEITRSAAGRVLMLWYDDSAVKVGKYKDTVTSTTWNDL